LKLKVALGQMATDSVPVSAEWALVWAENDPSMPRRTPSQRCREEFRELFKLRYIEKFGEGLRLKSNKSFIRASYHPASSSFGGYVDIALPNLPDLTKISGPSSKICGIVNACTDELEGYSRYLGRNPGEKNSIEALSYLPQPLLKIYDGKEIQNLTNWLNNEASSDIPVTVPFSSILEQIPLHQGAFGKKEATALSSLLCKMSFGIEPDPRFGNFIPRPERDVVIFKIGSQAPNSPTAEYSAATTVLHLASAVACADGSVDASEEYLLEKHIETWFHLSPDEQTRLRAHTKWLLTFFPGMNGVKKRIELLKQDQRDSLGRFLIAIAQADGHMEPAEMKVLTNIYNILGLDVQNLFSQVHAAATEPVTVQPPNILKPSRYAIPSAPPKPVGGVSLDMDTVNAKIAETVAVSAMLNNIFIEDEPKPPIVSIEPSIPGASLTGLDSDSFAFMQILTSKPAWNREELERLAADRCLMLDGTLDCINDAAFDHFGGPFFEGDDPIEINLEYAKEIAA
jgi:tellurite resistance protein